FCNQCGARLSTNRPAHDDEGRARLYADIAHPINSECRELIQQEVIAIYQEELELAKQPGYVSRYDAIDDEYEPPPISSSTEDETGPQAADLPGESEATEEDRQSPLGKIPAPPEQILPTKPAASPPAPHTKKSPPRKETPSESKRQHEPKPARPNDEFGAGIF
ncbi:MAG: hypothetical protein MPJ50_19665, partial [Pirellulales bacterium]|nr:hypothetical protein [Pirellulales bacterium]